MARSHQRPQPKKSWIPHIFLLCVGVAGFLFLLTRLTVWLPFQYVSMQGRGEAAAENSVQQLLARWDRLHLMTRTDRIAQVIQANPWVERVRVHKSFDQGLHLMLHYRTPVMRSISGRFLVDSKGQIMATAVTNELLRLPTFSGDRSQVWAAYKVWVRLGPWQERLLALTHDDLSGWELLFDNKVTVRLGARHLTERLELFLKVAKHWSLLDTVEEQTFDMRYHQSFSHKKTQKTDR